MLGLISDSHYYGGTGLDLPQVRFQVDFVIDLSGTLIGLFRPCPT